MNAVFCSSKEINLWKEFAEGLFIRERPQEFLILKPIEYRYWELYAFKQLLFMVTLVCKGFRYIITLLLLLKFNNLFQFH